MFTRKNWIDIDAFVGRLELLDRMRRIILALSLYVFVCFVYYDPIFKFSKRNPGKKKKSLKAVFTNTFTNPVSNLILQMLRGAV